MNLPEVTNYDAGVYQIAITDPVQGYNSANGAPSAANVGIANQAALNLANRTNWLYNQINNILNGTTIPTGLAPLLSPQFTGSPVAPTPALGDNSTKLATTAFVQGTVNGRLALSVAGGTNVTLSAVQAGNAILTFSGALTANIAVIVPSQSGLWIVENNTTGAYTLTVKTAAGTGVAVTQNQNTIVFCDGTNVQTSLTDYPSIALTGTPTAPTGGQFNNSTQVATTAFVQRAIGNLSTYESHNASVTLPATSAGNMILLYGSAGLTCTLPVLTSMSAGAAYWIFNGGSNPWTVSVGNTSTDTIYWLSPTGTTQPTTVTLNPGDCIMFVASGGSNYIWRAWGVTSANLFASAALTGTPTAPTASQFNSSTQLATTAFVQRQCGNFSGIQTITAATTLTVSNAGNLHVLGGSAAYTVTLPAASSCPAGTTIAFAGYQSNAVTVARAGTDSILQGTTVVTSANLGNGDTLELVSNGTNSWTVEDGTVQLPYAAVMSGANFTTPALFDNTTRLATTAFVKASGFCFPTSTGLGFPAATTLTTSQLNGWGQFQGASLTVTLPTLASTQVGATFTFLGGGFGGTIKGNGTDAIYNAAAVSANTLAVAVGETITVACDGATGWFVVSDGVAANSPAFSGTPTAPTAAQFSSSLQLATTAFVKAAGFEFSGGGTGFSANTTLATSYMGGWGQIQANGVTVTLPSLASVAYGATYTFVATSYTGTIKAAGSDLMSVSGAGGLSTYSPAVGETFTFIASGGAWFGYGGTCKAAFPVSINAAGYQKLPSGLIIQWGGTGASVVGGSTVTFPIAFPNGCLNVTLGATTAGGAYFPTVSNSTMNSTSFPYEVWNTGGTSTAGLGTSFIAIGY